MGGKNAEVARSTGLSLTQTLLIKYNTFPIEYQAKFDMVAFKINIKKMFNLFQPHHLRSGEMVVAITCILHANILR